MTHTPVGLTVAVLDHLGTADETAAALKRVGAIAFATTDPKEAVASDGLVIPDGSDFAGTLAALEEVHGARVIGQRLAGARPVLAIGTGMQVLFEQALLDGPQVAGLGEWPGVVDKLEHPCETPVVEPAEGSELMRGVEGALVFDTETGVHRFDMEEDDFIAYPRLSWAECEGERYLAAVENGALWAVQFSLSRSGAAAETVLTNWLAQLG